MHLHSASSSTLGHKLKVKLSIYKGNPDTESPEILTVGDIIIRFLKLPGSMTYCHSEGKTADFRELIPALFDISPTVHTVIAHTGTNEVMFRQSAMLHYELEFLTVESLATYIAFYTSFLPAHADAKNFATASGLGFISHFDSFWTRWDLFIHDRLHPNRKGTEILISNFF